MKIKSVLFLFFLCSTQLSCNSKSEDGNHKYSKIGDQEYSHEINLKQQILQHPDSILLIEELLQWYRDNNKHDVAIHLADSMTKTNNTDKSFHRILAVLYYEINDTPNAILHFEKVVSHTPKLSDWLSLGSLYAGKKNSKAIEVADFLAKSDPNNHLKESYFIKGTYFESLQDYEKAISYFDSCIQLEFSFMEAYREKAICMINQKKYKEALGILERAITLNNRFADGHFWKGVCFEKLAQKENAVLSYQNALFCDTSYLEAREALDRISQK